jgi:hypothetical protein
MTRTYADDESQCVAAAESSLKQHDLRGVDHVFTHALPHEIHTGTRLQHEPHIAGGHEAFCCCGVGT